MSIKIGSASIDERLKAKGGVIGDQTKKEIKVQQFYDYPWDCYIEYPDKSIAEKAASYMEDICLDDNYGYDQGQRLTGYYAIKNNNGNVNGVKGEFDCSSLVSSCYNLAGVKVSPDNSTFSMRYNFLKAGFKIYTDAAHVHSDTLATRGGIYLSDNNHVVMALENGIGVPVMLHAKEVLKKNEPKVDTLQLAKNLFTKGIITDVELWHKILEGEKKLELEWLIIAFSRALKL